MTLETIGTMVAQKGLETIATELVKSLIETHIKPIFCQQKETERNFKEYKEFQECLQEYLQISYRKAMIMNTIVFKDLRTPKTLCDLYIPLTLQSGNNHSGIMPNQNNEYANIDEEKPKKYIINDNYKLCIDKYDKILIMDTAGMGKSTLVKYLAAQEINNNRRIPIIIELRKLRGDISILEYVCSQFKLLDKIIAEDDLIKMMKAGNFIIFFDGYDEINEDYRGKVLDDLQDFITKAGDNKYVITSRKENDLSCLGDFYGFSIKPLSMKEAFALIRKYDSNGHLGELLINRIQNEKNLDILKEFLINPLLVSLLYKTFDYKREIPYKKIEFYEQVYAALFNDHDKTKGSAYVHPKKSNLDLHDFEKVLRRIGFLSLQKRMIEFRRTQILEIIDKAISSMAWLRVTSVDFLNDLTHAVPLFQREGNDYKWSHKSFMEYFAAEYICYESNKPGELFEKMVKSENIAAYVNVLDFCYDIRPDIMRKVVLYPHLKEYIRICEDEYTDAYYNQFGDIIEYRHSLEFENDIILLSYGTEKKAKGTFENHSKIENIFSEYRTVIENLYFPCGCFMMGVKPRNTIIINQLLRHKGIDIFAQKEEKKEFTGVEFAEGVYKLNDDPDNIINASKLFSVVTLMMADRISDFLRLSYKKCLALFKQLENEMKSESIIDIELL